MSIEFKSVSNKKYMESIEVTVNGNEILVSDGFIYNTTGEKQALEGVSFLLEQGGNTDVIYDLYVVETGDSYTYELLKTYTTNSFTACYDGSSKLIHTFISIKVTSNGEIDGHVTTIDNPKDGDPVETNKPERKKQAPTE